MDAFSLFFNFVVSFFCLRACADFAGMVGGMSGGQLRNMGLCFGMHLGGGFVDKGMSGAQKHGALHSEMHFQGVQLTVESREANSQTWGAAFRKAFGAA